MTLFRGTTELTATGPVPALGRRARWHEGSSTLQVQTPAGVVWIGQQLRRTDVPEDKLLDLAVRIFQKAEPRLR